MPRRGCGVRGRALTPSGISNTRSKTPGTSWTPCTRSQSTVSWHQLWSSLPGSGVTPVLCCLPACLRPQGPAACAALLGCCSQHPLTAESWHWLHGSRRAPPQQDQPLCFCSAAIIEHVRDGSVVRALLLPDYYLVTVMLSGIKVRLGCWPRQAGVLSSPLCRKFPLEFALPFIVHPPWCLSAPVQVCRACIHACLLPGSWDQGWEGWGQGYSCLVARYVVLHGTFQ